MKTTKTKFSVLIFSTFVFGILFFGGAKNVLAAACFDNGGTCWAVGSCSSYMSGGKDLIAVTAGDAACANVYSAPVKCCKIGGVSSSKPAATSDGTDTGGGGAASSTEFVNPLQFKTVDQFLTTIMGALQKIIVTLSLVMIVYGAVLYVISGGGKQVETAKNAITAALVGLAIGMAAPSFLKEIAGIIGWGGTTPAALSLSEIAINVLNFLLGILGILSLVMLVIGASMYLTSAGDQGRIDTGKNIFKSSLLGVIIAMASMVMVSQIAKFFVTTPSSSTATTIIDTTPGSGIAPPNGAMVGR